jgi:hypothetical protein
MGFDDDFQAAWSGTLQDYFGASYTWGDGTTGTGIFQETETMDEGMEGRVVVTRATLQVSGGDLSPSERDKVTVNNLTWIVERIENVAGGVYLCHLIRADRKAQGSMGAQRGL